MIPAKYRDKLSFIVGILLLGLSCDSECNCEPPPEDSNTCYFAFFEDFKRKPEALKISEYRYRSENVYLMETRMPAQDGSHPVINIYCDTICYLGNISPLSCAKDLVYTALVWQK